MVEDQCYWSIDYLLLGNSADDYNVSELAIHCLIHSHNMAYVNPPRLRVSIIPAIPRKLERKQTDDTKRAPVVNNSEEAKSETQVGDEAASRRNSTQDFPNPIADNYHPLEEEERESRDAGAPDDITGGMNWHSKAQTSVPVSDPSCDPAFNDIPCSWQ